MNQINLSSNFRRELKEISKKLDACGVSIEHLNKVDTLGKLYKFFTRFGESIHDNYAEYLLSLETDPEICPTSIINYLESPFTSDYDKKIVIDYVMKKGANNG